MTKFSTQRPVCVCDTECYVDYWSIGFRTLDRQRTAVYELFEGNPLNKKAIASVFKKYRVYTFNGINYDLPMILYAMAGASNAELKRCSDDIIVGGTPWWTMLDRLGLRVPEFMDHVDLMSVSPGAPQKPSLKIYAGRLHSRKMQELPIAIDAYIGESERQVIRAYHGNDLDVTIDLATDLKPQLELRGIMSDEYGVDLRSKSDAQIAEAVIKAEIERATGKKLWAPDIEPGYFEYKVPQFIRFGSQRMREVLHRIRGLKFVVAANGVVQEPEYLKDAKIDIGKSVYRMGIGGLHSSEQSASHYSDDEYVLIDSDVTSYYPSIILNCGLFPKHIGPIFLKIYQRIFEHRLAAKKAGDKNTAETLKIVLNGSFGKFGSPFSALYSPNLMIQTTMTGQLAILMLMEDLEAYGIEVISANTDGFVSKVPRARLDTFRAIKMDWEWATGFGLEETVYRSLHSRDVNNYIAIDEKGKVKTKGAYAASGPGLPGAAGQKKNPDMDICVDAVVEYLKSGKAIEDTIEWEIDPRRFITVRRVTGGALDQEGQEIGKALRWYYSKNVSGGFVYKKNGNAVPQTIGAKLMMTLPDIIPSDIDYDYYTRESYAILQDLGVNVPDPRLRGRTGRLIARLPDQKTFHLVDSSTGVALCGKRRDSIRDSWVESESRPEGRELCKKCRELE